MASSLERYGTGSGIPLGVGIGATAASLAGLQSEFAVVVAFGAMGGVVVGGFAGRFAEESRDDERWKFRVMAFTHLVSLLAGGTLGGLTAWMVGGALGAGVVSGTATGGAFGLLLGSVLVAAGRRPRPDGTPITDH